MDILGDNNKILYKKDTKITSLITDQNGYCETDDLPLGRYRVVETQAPAPLVIDKTESSRTKIITLSYAGQTVEFTSKDVTYVNERPQIRVSAIKKSQADGSPLQGAVYGLYAGEDIPIAEKIIKKGTLIQSSDTNKNGIALFSTGLPIGTKYYIKEIKAPEKYVLSDQVYHFEYTYLDDETYEYVFSHDFTNQEVRGEIIVKKVDHEINDFIPQGDARLSGATYGLYAGEDIPHTNQSGDILYPSGTLIEKGEINAEGSLTFNNLYLGKYFVMEIEPAEGYLLDETMYPVELPYEGQTVELVHREITVREQIKKQSFQLIKTGTDGEQTESDLLQGAGFKVYLISSLAGVKNGDIKPDENGNYSSLQFRNYDFTEDNTAMDYSENASGEPMPELFSDKKGHVISRELAYGQYVMIESTVPDNYSPIDPFIVTINEDSREPQPWRVFADKEFQALLKIYKMDGTSKLPVLHAGATFRIYDMESGEYIKQYTHYPKFKEHTEFVTSNEGYLVTPEKLSAGHYRIEEIKAPTGYIPAGPFEIFLNSDSAYEIEPETGAVVIILNVENKRIEGGLRIHKTGELLDDIVQKNKPDLVHKIGEVLGILSTEEPIYDFEYITGNVDGAKFNVYANNYIFSPDGQKDEHGNVIILYRPGELVGTLTTDSEGRAELSKLPLGAYKITEIIAGDGFVLNKDVQEFELKDNGEVADIIYHDSEYVNERQKVSLQIKKLDAQTDNPVCDALIGLFAAEDIMDHANNVIVEKDTLIGSALSGEDGAVIFTQDLPIAHYYAKELRPAPGYILNDKIIDFDLVYGDQNISVITAEAELKNDFTKIEFLKVDVEGNALPGATLTLKDSDGNIVDSWVTDGKPHLIERLEPGEYILIEEFCPEGYEIAEDIIFTATETGTIQKVVMVDEYEKKGTISIVKIGDMLTGASTYDSDFGTIYRMEYEKRELPGVEFTVYDEDGNITDVITTGEDGIGISKELSLGKYTVKETKTPAGLALNFQEYEVVIEKGQENAVIDATVDVENHVLDTQINVYKVGEMLNADDNSYSYGKKPLEGVYFGIYTNEDIENYKNQVVVEKDQLIGVIKTNEEGIASLKAAPISGKYYYKELRTLEGYILDNESHPFTLTLENEPLTIFDVNKENPALNMLKKAKVTLKKVDASNENKYLPGVEFCLYTDAGDCIGTYTTDSQGEILIENLGYGDYYFKETKAADGYQKINDKIMFSIQEADKDITITCKNQIVPKLGFVDSNKRIAIIFVLIGIVFMGAGMIIYLRKKKYSKGK